MRRKSSAIYNIWFAFIVFYICFRQLIKNDNWMYLIIDMFFLMIMMKKIYLDFKITNFSGWLFYFLLATDMFFSTLYAIKLLDAIKFTFIYLSFLTIAFLFTQLSDWSSYFYKWLKIGCLFHLAYTIFSVYFTETALRISGYFLTTEDQLLTERWIEDHQYAGISGQLGTNAFFFTILIGLFLVELSCIKRNRLLTRFLFISSWIGLLLTGKKGLMISSFFATLVVCWVSADRLKKRVMMLFINVMAVLTLLISVIFNQQIFQFFFNSVYTRVRLINGMKIAIGRHPLLGNGVNSITSFTHDQHLGHNIYLQMWGEQGIIGLMMLFLAFLYTLHLTYIRIKQQRNLPYKYQISSLFSLFIQVFVIIYGCFGNPIYDYNILVTYFLAVAAGFIKEISCSLQNIS